MKVAVIGAGKLGMPVALAFERYGRHDVLVTDTDERVDAALASKKWPHREELVGNLLKHTNIENVTLSESVASADFVFVCVQTPHAPQYDGAVRLPDDRCDFDYSYLRQAIADVADVVREKRVDSPPIVCCISTVLPGTCRRELLPLLRGIPFCYNPFFAAMGTVVADVLEPEFVLLGHNGHGAFPEQRVRDFYLTLHLRPVLALSIESAELVKVAYNTWISTKICFVNTLMEVAHKTPGCDVDSVTGALKMANRRLISTRYMNGGLGDGGACHPRDNIAMSWLAERLDLSYNLFDAIMQARENQTVWLAHLMQKYSEVVMDKATVYLPLVIMGKSFKPESNITAGSAAMLVANVLDSWGARYLHVDPVVDDWGAPPGDLHFVTDKASVFLIATKHEVFRNKVWYPKGSVVIDPHRFISPEQHPGVTVIPVGVGR